VLRSFFKDIVIPISNGLPLLLLLLLLKAHE